MSLTREILAAIEQSPHPIPTPRLIAEFGYGRPNPRQLIWGTLVRLEKLGFLTREVRAGESVDGGRIGRLAYWSRTHVGCESAVPDGLQGGR